MDILELVARDWKIKTGTIAASAVKFISLLMRNEPARSKAQLQHSNLTSSLLRITTDQEAVQMFDCIVSMGYCVIDLIMCCVCSCVRCPTGDASV